MSDTPTPAQADEKALIEAAKVYNDSLDGRHFGATRRIIETYLAALRPEGEAVAFDRERFLQDDSKLPCRFDTPPAPAQAKSPLKMLIDRDQLRTMIEQSPDEDCEAGCLHPEAPAQVEAASLPAPGGVVGVDAWVRQQAPAILAMYRFDSDDDLRRAREAFDILRARLPNCAALATDASPSGESEETAPCDGCGEEHPVGVLEDGCCPPCCDAATPPEKEHRHDD